MNNLSDLPEMKVFFSAIFDFIRQYRIHSFLDHMSDYSQLFDILMSSQLEDLRYYHRMDQYVLKLRNENNRLVDLVYLFSFGCDGRNDQQIMITLNNEKIRVEIIITDNREIPIMKYSTPDKKIAAFWKKKEPPREKMTLQDWDEFLESHNKQYPRRMK